MQGTFQYTDEQQRTLDAVKSFLTSKDDKVFVLTGFAGTGKTTLIKPIISLADETKVLPMLMAPTGRAAKILRDKTGRGATTIHKGIYSFDAIISSEGDEDTDTETVLRFGIDKENASPRIIIVDEASLISSKNSISEQFVFGSGNLLDDILEYADYRKGSKVIFIGDPAQLPPVGDNISNALNPDFFRKKGYGVKVGCLMTVIRQANESLVLTNATMIRDLIGSPSNNRIQFTKKEGEFEQLSRDEIISKYVGLSAKPDFDSPVVICFENSRAADYNADIRERLFPGMKTVAPGDKLIITENSYDDSRRDVLNGEFAIVVSVSDTVEKQSAPIFVSKKGSDKKEKIIVTLDFRDVEVMFQDGTVVSTKIIDSLLQSREPGLSYNEFMALHVNALMRFKASKATNKTEFMKSDPYYNALKVKYGYAITAHKSQGGEWQTVFVDYSGRTGLNDDCLKWMYTATTRAKKVLYGMNIPEITPFSKLAIKSTIKSSKAPVGFRSFNSVREDRFHSNTDKPCVKARFHEVEESLQGSDYRIISVVSKPYREIYTFEGPDNRIIRCDATYDGAGSFKDFTSDQPGSEELLQIINSSSKEYYEYNYTPSTDPARELYNRVLSACSETDVKITNVVEDLAHYKVIYHFRTSGRFSSIEFYIDKNGFVSSAIPHSDLGDQDITLNNLLEKLNCNE